MIKDAEIVHVLKHRRSTIYGMSVISLLLLYIGSYFFLSKLGKFETSWFSRSGVKYDWVPLGFQSLDHKSGYTILNWIYLPLNRWDRDEWHPMRVEADALEYNRTGHLLLE